MKNIFRQFTALAAVIFTFTLTACFSEWKGDEGALIINLGGGGGGSRDASGREWPPDDKMLTELNCKITLSGRSGTILLEAKGGTIVKTTVSPGIWHISAEAFLDGEPYAYGKTTTEVKAGTNNSVTLKMNQVFREVSFNDLDKLNNYLKSLEANEPDNPYPIKLNITDNNFAGLKAVLFENEDKYVNLNLSGSNISIIPEYAFYETMTQDPWGRGCVTLTGITIPDSVTSIGQLSFTLCANLASVTIPNSVTSIGAWAFSGCTGLTGITIPNRVTTIVDSTFMRCTGLAGITIPDNVTSIEDDAFNGCTGLKSVTIGSGVESIGQNAFNGCTGLTSVIIPDSVTSIGVQAFYGCTGLTSVTMDNVQDIGQHAFSGCTSLTSVTMTNVQSIGVEVFNGCTGLTNIIIPASVTSIGDYAFYYCEYLTSVEFQGNSISWPATTRPAFLGDLDSKAEVSGEMPATYTTTDTPVNIGSNWTKQP